MHTPGPWIVKPSNSRFGPKVESVVGRDFIICQTPINTAEDWSNAKLIAAAPDLLKTLETLIEDCEHASGSSDYNYGEFDLNDAKAAIIKAKGEQA